MSNKIRRTEINIETHAVTIIRMRGSQTSIYCQRCQKTVAAFTPAQVSTFLPKTDVHRSLETGDFHLINESLVCGNSLGSQNTTP